MLLLTVDTSGRNGSLALARVSGRALELVEEVALAGSTFSAQLVPQTAALLAKYGYGKPDLAGFAVVSGPGSFTGLRVGLGIGWMALVAGELVAAPTGLGYMINNARTLFRSDYILLGMVLIGLLGLVLDFLMRQVARLAMPWYQGR